jgi:hypothetical protein
VLNFHQAIPVFGGLVGGGIDYLMTRRLGEMASVELGRRGRPADFIDVDWR